jgi:hypothetical protein
MENVFLGVYLWELGVKLFALRMRYFNSYWNNFDLIIIVLSLVAWLIQGLADVSRTVSNMISIIRVFRIVRIIRFLYELKKVKFLKSLQIIIETLFKSLSIILNIASLAGIFLCENHWHLLFDWLRQSNQVKNQMLRLLEPR